MGVVLAGQQRQFLTIARRLAAFVHRLDGSQALGFVAMVLRPMGGIGQTLAQVMQQAGPACRQG